MRCFWSLQQHKDTESHRINVVFSIYKEMPISDAEKWEGINTNIYFKNTGAGYKSEQQVKPCHVLARKMGGKWLERWDVNIIYGTCELFWFQLRRSTGKKENFYLVAWGLGVFSMGC